MEKSTNRKKILSKRVIQLITFLYPLVILGEAYAVYNEDAGLELLIKPFLMIALIAIYFLSSRKICIWYLFVLFFSLLGDLCIIYRFDEQLLLTALISFFLAHCFLIFIMVRSFVKKISINQIILYTIPFLIAIGLIFYIISENLNEMFIPVLLHTIMISLLCAIGFINFMVKPEKNNLWLLLGVFSFVTADCFFGVYRFFEASSKLLVVTTILYAVGQFLVLRAIISKSEETPPSLY